MSIRIQLTFIGTGRPMHPDLRGLGVNRQPSRNGIIRSGAQSQREFNRINSANIPTNEELGRSVGKAQRKIASGSKIDFEA